ncbi:MAG: HaeIII family restriction endonuclease [bacterium]|nr:HaeIII family restriction endonuclease [bacterium]
MPIDQGRAFEYACISALNEAITRAGQNPTINRDSSFEIAEQNFNLLADENREHAEDLRKAASKVSETLLKTEPKLNTAEDSFRELTLSIQPDTAGMSGDVRDVIVIKASTGNQDNWEIGLSCKHNHQAVKHQRVSPTIDFGDIWLGFPLSQDEKLELNRIFGQIDNEIAGGKIKWSEVETKEDRYYIPILNLILGKIGNHPEQSQLANHFLGYLIGKKDFYKAIYRQAKGTVQIQGFNLYGSLNKPAGSRRPEQNINRINLPERIIGCGIKPGSKTTLEIFFDRGWQVSMRVHNASTRLEKSLKMDVGLIGNPQELFSFTHTLNDNQ